MIFKSKIEFAGIKIGELGYGFSGHSSEQDGMSYAINFPKNGIHEDIRIILSSQDVEVVDQTETGSDKY